MREAGMKLEHIGERLNVCVRAVARNLELGSPANRKVGRKHKKACARVVKRRALVKKLLTRRVVKAEDFLPTTNMDGSIRANSKQPRTQTRHPTGTLGRCRRALFESHSIETSVSSIRRDRLAIGLLCRRRGKGPERYAGDEEKRLAHAIEWLPFAKQHRRKVLFVDEKMFDSKDTDTFCYIFPGQVPPAKERSRFPPRVHVFGCIGWNFRSIHVFDVGQKVTAEEYRTSCLVPLLTRLRLRYFLHDGAGPHKGVRSWLEEQEHKGIIPHPARSPDMNPIERFWAIIQFMVSAHGPLTDVLLKTFVMKCWKDTKTSTINGLVDAWPRMLEAVIANKGATCNKNLKKEPL